MWKPTRVHNGTEVHKRWWKHESKRQWKFSVSYNTDIINESSSVGLLHQTKTQRKTYILSTKLFFPTIPLWRLSGFLKRTKQQSHMNRLIGLTHSCPMNLYDAQQCAKVSRLSVTNVIIVCGHSRARATFSGTEIPHSDNGLNDSQDFYSLTAWWALALSGSKNEGNMMSHSFAITCFVEKTLVL